MPLGNGDIGLNVWVEPSGDLVLLISKTDSFDEFNRLLKIGRIRVRTTPALFHPGMAFSQALRLADGAIEIKSRDTSIRVWVDANGNGDLTDDATPNWADKPMPGRDGKEIVIHMGDATVKIPFASGGADAKLVMYRFDKSDTARAPLMSSTTTPVMPSALRCTSTSSPCNAV